MKKKKLYILCPYPFDVAPSQRLKVEQYYASFREAGYSLKVSSFISLSFWNIIYKKGNLLSKLLYTVQGYLRRFIDLCRIPFYDVVYVHLWVSPFGPPLFERAVRLLAKHLVYDIDDMIYLRENQSQANPVISNLKGKNKPLYLFKHADCVLTSTDAIEEFAKKLNDNVANIPVTIDTDIYTPKNDYAVKGKITLGWSGSVTTVPYLHLLDNVLRKLRQRYDFRLLVMGDESVVIDGVEVTAIPWKAAYEVSTIRSFDIGLYPLSNDQWVLGKGGGKALQYMSLGVPTVATTNPVNSKIITHGVNGFLVNTEDEWLEALGKLIESEYLRKSIGEKGVYAVEQNFSVNANKNKYLRLLTREQRA